MLISMAHVHYAVKEHFSPLHLLCLRTISTCTCTQRASNSNNQFQLPAWSTLATCTLTLLGMSSLTQYRTLLIRYDSAWNYQPLTVMADRFTFYSIPDSTAAKHYASHVFTKEMYYACTVLDRCADLCKGDRSIDFAALQQCGES